MCSLEFGLRNSKEGGPRLVAFPGIRQKPEIPPACLLFMGATGREMPWINPPSSGSPQTPGLQDISTPGPAACLLLKRLWHKGAGPERLWERKRRESFGDLVVLGRREVGAGATQGPAGGRPGRCLGQVLRRNVLWLVKSPRGLQHPMPWPHSSVSTAENYFPGVRKNCVTLPLVCVCFACICSDLLICSRVLQEWGPMSQLKQYCYSIQDRMVLAQKQKCKSMGWDRKPRDKSMQVAT